MTEAQRRRDPIASPVLSRGDFTSIQVNVDAQRRNIFGDAANEPSIAVDPTNPSRMVIAWRQFDTIASNFRQAGIAHSHDAGDTWSARKLTPGFFRSDPVMSVNRQGHFYFSSLSSVTSVEIFRSLDGAVSWSAPVPAYGGDKQWMTVDRTEGTGSGHVYQIWNSQFSCCGDADFTRSIDGGLNYQAPLSLPPPKLKWGTLDVGPDGTLYIVGADLSQSSHLFTFSTNARLAGSAPTFAPPQIINLGGVTTGGGIPNPGGLAGQVWIATDHSNGPTRGNIYVLASVDPPGFDPLDVMFIRSSDDGANWSEPLRINDDPPDSFAYQWFGTMSVAPNGRIDVIWNDTRSDSGNRISVIYHSASIDGGLTWSVNAPITPPFDPSLGYPQQNKIGDYYHMVADARGAHLAYSATFNGEQDVYYLRIPGDCNLNGLDDAVEIEQGLVTDCTGNGIPDECEADCNANAIADSCDILSGFSFDCAADGVPDECEPDCNGNSVADSCDLLNQTSTDLNHTRVPDECERIIHVNASATGAGHGRSWPDACVNLQSALEFAGLAPGVVEEIWVAKGAYRPSSGDRTVSFQLRNGVALYGGFAGGETYRSQRNLRRNRTILTGDLFGDDLPGFVNRGDNSYHVVKAANVGASAVLDGFVIVAGNADGNVPDNVGGGLTIGTASPTIRHCVFADHHAFSQGGAIAISTQSAPTLIDCLVAANSAFDGGAILLGRGSTLTLDRCTIANNSATALGGGVFGGSGTTTLFAKSTIFWGNTDTNGSGQSSQISGVVNVLADYSCIEGWTGLLGGAGNIGDDPLFVDPPGPDGNAGTADDDFRLSASSPAINAGDPSVVLASEVTDLDGHARVLCGRVDIGAYEFGIGDFNCDLQVNLLDVGELPACLTGPSGGPFAAGCESFDFDGDGDVDLADFAAIELLFVGP